jgi:hypothetical protein
MQAINVASGVVTQIAGPGTFSNPDVAVWQASTLLIADAQAGYSAWNGTTLTKPGGLSPNIGPNTGAVINGGSGYASGATAVIVGGSGTGATVSVQTVAGVVTGLTLTSPGINFAAGDILSGNITAAGTISTGSPTVTMPNASGFPWVVPGMAVYDSTTGFVIGTVLTYTGTTLTLTANAAHNGLGATDVLTFSAVNISPVAGGSNAFAIIKVWPQFAIQPTTLAVYSGRVWLGGGRTLTWTGTKGFDDAAAADASGSTNIPDSDRRRPHADLDRHQGLR